MKTVVIIPSRMASKRLSGKPLMLIRGLSLVCHCYWSARCSTITNEVYVASSDINILKQMRKRAGKAIETSDKPVNGTERVAEAARILGLAPDDIVVNLQGDMPFFNPEIIDGPVKKMKAVPECRCASVMTLLKKGDINNPNRVKVTVDKEGRALSFSRGYGDFLHVGVYVFRNSILQRYAVSASSAPEIKDKLEQKRMDLLDIPIWMTFVDNCPVVIDTKEDLENAQKENS